MSLSRLSIIVPVLACAVLLIFGIPASAQSGSGAVTPVSPTDLDRHAGYYYPETVTHELYKARARTFTDSDRNRRLAFVTGVTAQQTQEPYPPVTAMFAKGTDAEKLILVSLQEGRMDTLFRARAVLAMLTATARTTQVFANLDPEVEYTFLDLLKLLGFEQLTVSDGRTYAHQITIE